MPIPHEPGPKEARSALDDWNQAPLGEAELALLSLCGSGRWAGTLAARRPFADPAHLHHAAANLWFLLDERDWLEAFACHPRIGTMASAGEKAAGGNGFRAHSEAEQQAAQATLADGTAAALAEGNRRYEQRFGFLYIVFASGRTAPELLEVLTRRLGHDRITELHEAARQQHCITELRMRKWLGCGEGAAE